TLAIRLSARQSGRNWRRLICIVEEGNIRSRPRRIVEEECWERSKISLSAREWHFNDFFNMIIWDNIGLWLLHLFYYYYFFFFFLATRGNWCLERLLVGFRVIMFQVVSNFLVLYLST